MIWCIITYYSEEDVMKLNSETRARYGQKRRISRTGLAIVVALHAAAITAAFLVKSEIERTIIYRPIPTTLIEAPVEPDEIPPPRPVDTPPLVPVVVLTPIVQPTNARPAPIPPPVDVAPLPPAPPVPAPEPVFVEAGFDPAHRRSLQPRYPATLLRQEIEGQVTVRVRIEANGRVSAVELISADHQAFFEATRRHALRRWRFRPATRDGQPVASWQPHTVYFRITG
jgi:protein TonB